MKYRTPVFVFLILFINFNAFSQDLQPGFPKLMFVNAKAGLRERTEPSIRGNINRTLLYGETVQVFFRQNTAVTIDGITDYWYSTLWSNNSDSWIFGGYLSEELPSDLPVIIGRWDDKNNEIQYYDFSVNHRYAEGYKETGMGIWGTWRLDGNTLTIMQDSAMGDIIIDPPEEWILQLNIIDRNNINLLMSDNRVIMLSRNRTGW